MIIIETSKQKDLDIFPLTEHFFLALNYGFIWAVGK